MVLRCYYSAHHPWASQCSDSCLCLFILHWHSCCFLNVLKLKRQYYHIYGIIGRCFLKVKLTSTSCKSSYLQRNSGQNGLFDREIRYVGVVRGLGSRPLLTKENQHFSSASANKKKKKIEKKEEEAKQVFLFNPENTVRWEQHKAGGGWRYIKSWSIFKFQILIVCVQTPEFSHQLHHCHLHWRLLFKRESRWKKEKEDVQNTGKNKGRRWKDADTVEWRRKLSVCFNKFKTQQIIFERNYVYIWQIYKEFGDIKIHFEIVHVKNANRK